MVIISNCQNCLLKSWCIRFLLALLSDTFVIIISQLPFIFMTHKVQGYYSSFSTILDLGVFKCSFIFFEFLSYTCNPLTAYSMKCKTKTLTFYWLVTTVSLLTQDYYHYAGRERPYYLSWFSFIRILFVFWHPTAIY